MCYCITNLPNISMLAVLLWTYQTKCSFIMSSALKFTFYLSLCTCSLQAVDWRSCWFSVGSSFPGPAPVTVSATLHPALSLAKPTTSWRSPKAFLLTVNASFYKTTRSTVYFGATSAQRLSLSGSTPITSPTLSPPLSTDLRYLRTWIWVTIGTCAHWLKTPFMGWVGLIHCISTAAGWAHFLITSSKASETCSISTCRYTRQFQCDWIYHQILSFFQIQNWTSTLLEIKKFHTTFS